MQFDRVAMVARWKPVHLGQAAVLRALCSGAGHALIGVGSSNRYNVRNPFTFEETESMLRLALASFPLQGLRDTAATNTPPSRPTENYEIMPVPDLDDGPRWRVMVKEMFGELDAFVT